MDGWKGKLKVCFAWARHHIFGICRFYCFAECSPRVFHACAEGLDVIGEIGTVPTFLPKGNLKAYNEFASFIGDERAGKARAKWGKPLKAVVITGSGVLG